MLLGGMAGMVAAGSLLPKRAQAAGLTQEDIAAATGPLNFIGAEPYQVRDTWPAGLDINWAYNTSNEDVIVKTTQAGTFDALIIYQGMIDQLRKLDRIEPIDTSLLSNWDLVAPMFRDAEVIRRDGEIYAIPFMWGYGYLEYNADFVKAPASYEDLWPRS
ncbi:MAG: hypothetical protein QM699_16410 [Amaricoccus sp.]|uniref:hypothetical protein n=1 Tax=Amaricoccus sp. TaxID=1872485 RepID=UPI0039E26FB3